MIGRVYELRGRQVMVLARASWQKGTRSRSWDLAEFYSDVCPSIASNCPSRSDKVVRSEDVC